MDKIFDSLPELFYDFIGLFIPGFYFYFCLSLIYSNDEVQKALQISFINKDLLIVLLVYLSGHIIYSFSNYFVVKIFSYLVGVQTYILLGVKQTRVQKFFNKILLVSKINDGNTFYKTNIEKRIKELTKDSDFKLTSDNMVIAFEFCRNYIRENSPRTANVIRKEQAYGEMSRGIIFVAIVSIIWLTIQHFRTPIVFYNYKIMFYIFSLLCFSYRYNQARYVAPLFIYSTFCSQIRKNEKENKD